MVPRVERTQTSTVVDSDEEPLLPHEHECANVESAASAVSAVRSPPPGATQLEDVTNSFGAALGLDAVPRSGGDVDDEAIPDLMDSTFLDHLGVLSAIHDGASIWRTSPRVWGPVRVDAVVPAGVGYNGRFAVLAEELMRSCLK